MGFNGVLLGSIGPYGVLLKKNQWISALNNADKYVIKGRLYYKLADGQFVKVANTVTKVVKLKKTVLS